MIGIYELLNVGGKGIYEKYEEIYSSLWALSIDVYRAVFDISRLVTLQVYRINVDLIKKKKRKIDVPMQHQVVFHYIMQIKSYNFGTVKKKSLISQSEVKT